MLRRDALIQQPALNFRGRSLVSGSAQAACLHAEVGLSFWGGVDPLSGEVIDRHHPLNGQVIAGQVLAIPSGRGSCTGSSVLLELILNGHAPAALVFAEAEEILTLGVLVAQQLFDRSLPVVSIGSQAFAALRDARYLRIENGRVEGFAELPKDEWTASTAPEYPLPASITLNAQDQAMLAGEHGKATQAAMQILLRMAELQGARELVDITQAHIDGCIYTGPASLRFARQLADWGGQVKVPTTLNSISVDQRHWRQMGVAATFGEPASQLADAYVEMGASASFTCAPYLLDSAPSAGEQVVWAESNAVVYANSVLGARTLKYPDFLDICIALTGRAPLTGCHLADQRHATLRIDLPALQDLDDAFYPLLGYHLGLLCGSDIPVICGLEQREPTLDDLKAFGAAFATTSAAPMFHIVGVTPEAPSAEAALGGQAPDRILSVQRADLLASWRELDSGEFADIELISLGNPHFSLSEFARLAQLCEGRVKHTDVAVLVTCGREIQRQASEAGYLQTLERFGVQIITDTCWCMLEEPVVPLTARTLMTNSGKYAHYAPGLVGRQVRFGSLAECVDTACSGQTSGRLPRWLTAADIEGVH
ncbi:aconitase family protein [Pseudomonas sp. KSR10]|uniref:cis-3-hydroxy-L-proline dehydratase n=1 Tax=Pseudomonadaceae TaxID=135621 RepID=UPI0005EAD5A4|nr:MULTISPECIES: aconitase family protein [Pseudomonadaceae]MCG6539235.1 aconitase family protein [Pseudomonas sp. KSR10]